MCLEIRKIIVIFSPHGDGFSGLQWEKVKQVPEIYCEMSKRERG
ncbi:conserved hypothetical protein [delta proteobacterium NaphS2]|nr:conserved hypothetical protein [delta proteobacterium NaphS2]